jgi:hypothetical protein
MSKRMQYIKVVVLLFFVFIMYGGTSLIQAQDDAIEFPGEIIAIDGNIITVGGIAVDIGNAILPGDGLAVGMTVQVIGTRQDQTILATIVVITDFGEEPTPVPPEPEITAEPEVTAEPEIVIPVVQTVAITTFGTPIIVIEGPVQAINVDSITIFDIDIQVDAADPVLTEIRIGDTVRIAGESSFEGNTIIIVAVNITIVHTTLVIIQNSSPGVVVYIPSLPPSCKRTKKGKINCKKKSKKKSKKKT